MLYLQYSEIFEKYYCDVINDCLIDSEVNPNT